MQFEGRTYLSLQQACDYCKLSVEQVFSRFTAEVLVWYRGDVLLHEDAEQYHTVEGMFWIDSHEQNDDSFALIGDLLMGRLEVDQLEVVRLLPHYMKKNAEMFAGTRRYDVAYSAVWVSNQSLPESLLLKPSTTVYFWQGMLDEWLERQGFQSPTDQSSYPVDVLFPKHSKPVDQPNPSSESSTINIQAQATPVSKVLKPKIMELPATGLVSIHDLTNSPAQPARFSKDGKTLIKKAQPERRGVLKFSESNLHKMVREGLFPKPRKIGQLSHWDVDEVREWMRQRPIKNAKPKPASDQAT
ncbi:MAG: AlpA family phage regulatory protein [Pseudomonadota bacterium]|nr:AlpA family phage regulatory protein [Pseudomonadota bacterium]